MNLVVKFKRNRRLLKNEENGAALLNKKNHSIIGDNQMLRITQQNTSLMIRIKIFYSFNLMVFIIFIIELLLAFSLIKKRKTILYAFCLLVGPIASNILAHTDNFRNVKAQNGLLKFLLANLDSLISIPICILYIIFYVGVINIGYKILAQSIPFYFDIKKVAKDLHDMVIFISIINLYLFLS